MAILVLKSIKLSGLFQSLIEADLGQTVCLHKLVLASLSSTDDLEEPDPFMRFLSSVRLLNMTIHGFKFLTAYF